MILHAGPVGQLVMLILLAFSLISWSIVIMKFRLFKKCGDDSHDFLDAFWSSNNLNDAYQAAGDYQYSPEAAVFISGFDELQKINTQSSESGREDRGDTLETQLATMDILKRTIRKAESQEITELGRSLSFLATTGSAAPFIGLFGTVWGIMISFHDIGQRGSASLAVVAPGISEALVATAAGLAAAIPAVIFYNYYSNRLDEIHGDMQTFSSDFLNLVERNLLGRI